ncbi:MAG: hypothetical protein V2A65_02005 [Candidatus Omnitrophota bacterium]
MRADTEWFKDAGWGVFCHYLADLPGLSNSLGKGLSADDWNRRVDAFNLAGLVQQLESIGTRYFFLTIGQDSGHYCSPNATYDSFVGIKPSKCSRRDLISDLADALQKKGIRLLVYSPSGAPADDAVAVSALEWKWGFDSTGKRTGERLAEFQVKWEAIIREWSLRWGKKVSGWWIDGCYFADGMYRHLDPPNFQSFASALKAGNPEAIVAFNPGVLNPVSSLTEFEDYTSGEISNTLPVNGVEPCVTPLNRWVNGAQYHILTFLGGCWCRGMPRFPDDFPPVYTRYVNSWGGVVTWDVPITKEGLIPEPFFRQLMILGTALHKESNPPVRHIE